jgi:predicted nucleic acid-binding Zn ribbon protein
MDGRRYSCAVCGRRVRVMTRMNDERAAVTPVRHQTPAGDRCTGWLTAAIEEQGKDPR